MIAKGIKNFKRNIIIPDGLKHKLFATFNNIGIFTSAYKYDCKKQDNSLLYGDFYLDFDTKKVENEYDKVKQDALMAVAYLKTGFKIDFEDIPIFFSGQKGLHVTVPAKVLGIKPDKDLNSIFKDLAISIKNFTPNKTVDTQIYDNKRMFRLPGSIHEATGLHKISLSFEELKTLNYNEIVEMAKIRRILPNRPPKKNTYASSQYIELQRNVKDKLNTKIISGNRNMKALKVTPPCIKYLIENGTQEGLRNNTLAVLSSFYRRKGLSWEDTLIELEKWNNKLYAPLHPREVKRTGKSIYQSDKTYGCRTLENISMCEKSKCPLMIRRKK